jgi:hypothetical protein
MNDSQDSKAPGEAGRLLKCGDIREVLFEYMSRELGDARSELVREHLRRCADCQREAAEIQETLDLLHADSERRTEAAGVLSRERRRRLFRAYMHPLLDWIYEHHILVSIAVALVVISLCFCRLLKTGRLWSFVPSETGIPVTIGKGEPDSD